jgi:phytoene synthase
LRAALNHLVGEARGHLKTALTLLEQAPPEVRPVFLPLARVSRDLKRMLRAESDPFVPQVTSRFRTLWTLWRASRSHPFS